MVTRIPKPVVSVVYVHLLFYVNQMQSTITLPQKTGFQLQELLMPDLSLVSEDEAEGEKKKKNHREAELNRNRRAHLLSQTGKQYRRYKDNLRALAFGLISELLKQAKSLDLQHQKSLAVCASCTEGSSSFKRTMHPGASSTGGPTSTRMEVAASSPLTRGSWSQSDPDLS